MAAVHQKVLEEFVLQVSYLLGFEIGWTQSCPLSISQICIISRPIKSHFILIWLFASSAGFFLICSHPCTNSGHSVMFLSIHLLLNAWRAALSQESSLKESLKLEQCRFCLFQSQDCFLAFHAGFIVSIFVSGLYYSLLTVKIPSAHEASAWALSLDNPAWTENEDLAQEQWHRHIPVLMVGGHNPHDKGILKGIHQQCKEWKNSKSNLNEVF